jgi:hypothetical protein
MGCNCGKKAKVRRSQIPASAPAIKTGDVRWFAVPPPGSTEAESMHRTLYDARAAARQGTGPGWQVEGRRIEVVD